MYQTFQRDFCIVLHNSCSFLLRENRTSDSGFTRNTSLFKTFSTFAPNLYLQRIFASWTAQQICRGAQIRNSNFSLSRSEYLVIALAFPKPCAPGCRERMKRLSCKRWTHLFLFSPWSPMCSCLCISPVISILETDEAVSGTCKIRIQATSNSATDACP